MAVRDRVDIEASLSAGAAVRDITPPLEVGLLMSSVEGRWAPFESVRKPLLARVVALQGRTPAGVAQRVAVVALDMLALSGKAVGGFDAFKSRIAAAADHAVTPEQIVLACTHSHTAPESGAITDLYLTDAFGQWIEKVVLQIGQAIAAAADALQPCQFAYGSVQAPGLGIHRRFQTTRGIMMSHPEPPADVLISRDGAVDDSINVATLRNTDGQLIAVLVNATCHPVYEMCAPTVSPDYPGELTTILDETYGSAISLFLNGAAGNVNPAGVSAGPAEAKRHAAALAKSVCNAIQTATPEPLPHLQLRRQSFKLSTRLPHGEDVGAKLNAEVVGLRIGNAGFVFLPGEPFAETALAVRQTSAFDFTAVVGFAEETIGYIPTDQAFAEGGYEVSFGPWSLLAPGSERLLRQEAVAVLEKLMMGVEDRTLISALPKPHTFGEAVADRHVTNGSAAASPAVRKEVGR
jgi:neutral ceramidase